MKEHERHIPLDQLELHRERYDDYPKDTSFVPKKHAFDSFGGKSERFPDPKFYYNLESTGHSLIDVNLEYGHGKPNGAPLLGKYAKRHDHFLTKDIELQLIQE